ncbi:conjugal transfer protein TraK [Aureibaculum luteum]|uniref:conjugal transfer protein TraK n=1 Tax=Aureibaculum luteum TaxID=1548456 RepID=UPI000E476822|nr:conjugal transfer protein TraK [Aureibaculum luteum]
MKTPYENIYSLLKQNRFIVLSVVISSASVAIVSVFMVVHLYNKSVNNAYMVNTDGHVIPLQLVSQKENLEVETKAHLELFHTYFYNIDASNYEKNLSKALWLGDSTVDAIYRQKKSDGVYNRLLQYSLVQRVIRIESNVDLQKEPYRFECIVLFEINRGTMVDTYELTTTGSLIHVERNFPNNTHGLLITNFFEKTLKKSVASN